MEMGCYRNILCISYKDNVTNNEVHSRIKQAIGSYEDLLTTVKRRKLKWYGHVSRTSGNTKTIQQGTVKGTRRRGRQKKRCRTTSTNGQAWNSQRHKGRQTTARSGDSWFQCHRWCPNDTTGYGIDDDEDEVFSALLAVYYRCTTQLFPTFVWHLVPGLWTS